MNAGRPSFRAGHHSDLADGVTRELRLALAGFPS